jgi:hypothetical protein
MPAAPARTALADTYPNPSNSTFRTGIGALWDWATTLLGAGGTREGAVDTLRILEQAALLNLSLTFGVGSNALTISAKTRAGANASATDPAMIAQRSATAGNGDFNLRTITGALSLVVSSGSTLGMADSDSAPAYVYVIDNAGAQELAVSRKFFGVQGIVSTTAEGGAGGADSGTVMYSATARSNVPFRCVGRIVAPQTTAGTWAAVPSASALWPFDYAASLTEEDQVLTGGVIVTSKPLGTITSGTVTPDPGDRPQQHYTNGGAHTLGVSGNAGSTLVDITNNGSAGAITTSGFTKVTGDAFTTTNGHKFRCHVSIGNGGSLLQVQALQ